MTASTVSLTKGCDKCRLGCECTCGCVCHDWDPDLYFAAPYLLTALREMVEFWDAYGGRARGDSPNEAARTALARAEGKVGWACRRCGCTDITANPYDKRAEGGSW